MFTKKFYNLLLIITASLFLSISAASAYELNWNDQTNAPFAIGGFQLVNSQTDIAQIKQYTTGAFLFTEIITLTIINANDGDDGGIIPPVYQGEFTAEINLFGYSDLTPTSTTVNFTGGSGDLLHNGASILELTYGTSLSSTFADTLFSTTGLSAVFDVTFEVEDHDSNYFSAISGPSIQNLIDNDWFQVVTAGRFQVDSISALQTDTDGDFVIINTKTNGVDAKFNVVPEPTTMVLFGIGLLGLAGVTRRKVS